jgi:predicted GTPase
VDYERILRQAEKEADLILWDGGNNDTPFYASDLEIVVADPHRPGHELSYYPGEVNLRRADVVIINKVDTAAQEDIETVRANVRANNPKARVVEMACRVSVPTPELVQGRRVLVVEDGPTITHGGMPWGAGHLAAKQAGAAAIVDPRPFAAAPIAAVYAQYPHIGPVLPAEGYSRAQLEALRETINAADADVVVAATPIDLAALIRIDKPVVRARYEFAEVESPGLAGEIDRFFSNRKQLTGP